jgi:hypothetical protein
MQGGRPAFVSFGTHAAAHKFIVDQRAAAMNCPVNQIHLQRRRRRRAWLLATTMIVGALAAPAGAYVLGDNDPRMEELTAALPDTKASAAVAAKPINVEDVKDLVIAKAAAHGVPTELARAVVQVESDYAVGMTGSVGEVGLMQIKYETARILGYSGTLWELYEPETNIEWGMRYLAGARRLADGDLCGTVMRYNGGHGLKRMSRATTIYCNKVKRVLGLPADPVPVAELRDDGKRKDAPEKKQDERNDRTAAKRDKTTVKLAAAERKTEAAANNTKTSAKTDTKANARTADTAKQNAKAQGTKDTKTAQVNRDKPADRKVAAAAAKATAVAAKHSKVADAKQETKKVKLAEVADKKMAAAVAAKPQKIAEAKQETSMKKTKSVEPIDKKSAVSATAKQAKVAEAKQPVTAKNSKQIAPADKKITIAAATKQPKVADVKQKQETPAKHTRPVEPAAKATAATAAPVASTKVKSAARKHDKKLDQSAVTHAGATATVQADLVQTSGAVAAPAESRIRIADHRVSE